MVTNGEIPAVTSIDFDTFYAQTARRMLSVAYSLTGSWGDAEDLVQEAFVAAHRRWGAVGSFDDPAAWVRRVVTNRAVARLRAVAAMRPLPVLTVRPPRRWLVPLLAAATLVAVVLGLIAIGTNRNDRSVGNDPSDPRWILTDLPDGMGLRSVSGPNPASVSRSYPLRWVLYASTEAPAGPILAIVPDEFTDLADPATVEHVEVDGKQAVVARTRFLGQRWIDVELSPGHWVGMTTVGLDDTALLAAGAQLALGSDGLPTLAQPESLGLSFVGIGDPSAAGAVASDSAQTANSLYTSADGLEWWSLSVGPSSDQAWAWWGLLGARPVGDGKMFVLDQSQSGPVIVWERDGLAFRLELSITHQAGDGVMIRAAKSARSATEQEWSAALQQSQDGQPVDTVVAVAETTMPENPDGSWTDVHVEASVANVDSFSYRLTFTDRGSTPTHLDVQFIGRSLECDKVSIGITGGGSSGGGTICWVAGSQTAARPTALRIYGANGTRYIVDMQTLNGVTFAAYHVDGVDNPRADIVYADGTIEPF